MFNLLSLNYENLYENIEYFYVKQIFKKKINTILLILG